MYGPSEPNQTLRILVCEDETVIALALHYALNSMGHHVCGVAGTASECLEAARTHRPDLVLMDVMLRGAENGIDTATRLRHELDIPSLFMSALDPDLVRSRAACARPIGVLTKPYRLEELRRALDGQVPALAAARAERDQAEPPDRVYLPWNRTGRQHPPITPDPKLF